MVRGNIFGEPEDGYFGDSKVGFKSVFWLENLKVVFAEPRDDPRTVFNKHENVSVWHI